MSPAQGQAPGASLVTGCGGHGTRDGFWVPRANQERIPEVMDAWSRFQAEFPQSKAAIPLCVGVLWHGLTHPRPFPLLHPEFTTPGMRDNGIGILPGIPLSWGRCLSR